MTGDEQMEYRAQADQVARDALPHQHQLTPGEDARVLEGIRRSLEDVEAGRTQAIAEAFAEIRRDLDRPKS